METIEQGSPALKKKPYRERSFTIMVLGGLGKVRSFQISRRFLLWAGLFFASFILCSIVVINRYLELREVNAGLLDKAHLLEEESDKNKKALQRSRQRIALLEEYIQNVEERVETPPQAVRESSPQSKRTESVAGKAASTKDAEGAKSKSLAELLQIKDMLIEKEGAKLIINFKLVNAMPGDNPVGGYIHLIAEDSKSNPPRWWAYPQEKLNNGLPENFRSGQLFYINRYKLIQGKVHLGSSSQSPSAIKILIYDQSGTLVTERLFEVTNES